MILGFVNQHIKASGKSTQTYSTMKSSKRYAISFIPLKVEYIIDALCVADDDEVGFRVGYSAGLVTNAILYFVCFFVTKKCIDFPGIPYVILFSFVTPRQCVPINTEKTFALIVKRQQNRIGLVTRHGK